MYIYIFILYIRLITVAYERADELFTHHPILIFALVGALTIANKDEE